MKINWGTAIVLSFAAFITFILYFVVLASTDRRAKHDLVTEEYYKAELAYQQEIDAQQNAVDLKSGIKILRTTDGLQIQFPKNLNDQNTKGLVSLYRPSDKHLDFNLPLSLSNTHLLIPDKRLLDGRWDIRVFWEYQGKPFLHKESITY